MCAKVRRLVVCVRQNYIRPGPNEPNFPAWVPRRFQGPLTREQQKALLGHEFPGSFSSGCGCAHMCGPECVCIEHKFLFGTCMHVCACVCLQRSSL